LKDFFIDSPERVSVSISKYVENDITEPTETNGDFFLCRDSWKKPGIVPAFS
jgi:hypothetical protein